MGSDISRGLCEQRTARLALLRQREAFNERIGVCRTLRERREVRDQKRIVEFLKN
jgi:hypothetical protein